MIKSNSLPGEKWKEVKFDFDFTNDMQLEVSNFGRVRTYTKIADGKILNGSTINGYKQISLKLFKHRKGKAQQRLNFFKKEISKLTGKIALTKKQLLKKVKSENVFRRHKRKLKEETELFKLMKKKYRQDFRADEKKRTINYSFYVHKLVAEYFCNKPSDKHNLVIHLDHDKQNNRFDNLKWVTQEKVSLHSQRSPRVKASNKKRIRPDNAKNFKLTRTKVAIIKKRIAEGKELRKTARQFGISEMQLWRIKRGINWSDVKAAV